ncbi:unnamed protein product [Bursaphelenchus xylophilus]|uniref:(pine wood nematode) hypothetical protein n=1 Tax=Bursaphelenchus xylophilus TaxID=6326 RepID=A0A1I7ST94_BURXY|nr:unnamed protein product [Bursaphelenchus xylophilus]CAG9108631.1 unnamed protein product [Bursaphelenchus xylophilus]
MRLLYNPMGSLMSESAVIRARYIPDVKGVNRYKHFHTPLVLTSTSNIQMGNIDKDVSPRTSPRERVASRSPRNTTELPPLHPTSDNLNGANKIQKRLNGRENKSGMVRLPTSEAVDGKRGNMIVEGYRISSILPQLDPKGLNGQPKSFQNTKNIQTRKSRTPNSNHVPLIVLRTETVICPRRSNSMHSFPLSPKNDLNGHIQTPKKSPKSKKILSTNEGFTVTVDSPSTVNSVESSKDESKFSDIATQTDTLPILALTGKVSKSNKEIEQQQELLEIIESALDETIDRHSRQRTNRLIASSARKQAVIWRDAKEFVMTILIPESVSVANKTRYDKSLVDSISSIHLP